MKSNFPCFALALCGFLWAGPLPGSVGSLGMNHRLKLLTACGYLPQLPILVRVEVLDETGRRDWSLWEAEALLSTDTPGVALSTNRVMLRNGLGSALVSVTGEGDFNLLATFGGRQTHRLVRTLAQLPVTTIGGTLPGSSTTWRGVVLVTNDVNVPMGHTLTIESNTLVLIHGVGSGTVANDISVSGTILSMGTESCPVTITCAQTNRPFRWGQIRHLYAQPSVYRHTSLTRGGRGIGEGHTGTVPVVRALGSKIAFDSCSLTDLAETARSSPEFGQPGKVMQADFGADIVFDNCLLARARMGLELIGAVLLLTNSYVVEMCGVVDSDGVLIEESLSGQTNIITGSVIAQGDDDGIDTANCNFTVEHCIIRNWNNPLEDSKGISLAAGEARVRHCLLVDNAIGISGKGGSGEQVRLQVDHSTLLAEAYAIGATNKDQTLPSFDYRITNSIVRGTVHSVFTQYNPADIHVDYSNLGGYWPGSGNNFDDPRFVSATHHDYRLQPYSPCIDSGHPASPLNADGSRTDMGCFTFQPAPPALANPFRPSSGSFHFSLNAYPNRNYAIEVSTNLPVWNRLTTVFQIQASIAVADTNATDSAQSFYRAHVAP